MELPARLLADALITPTSRAQGCLVQAQGAAEDGAAQQAQRFLREALGYAQPQELRRVFVETRYVDPPLAPPGPATGPRPALAADPRHEPPEGDAPRPTPMVAPLTAREIKVLRQAAQMLSTEEIAAALHLSVNTVARCG